MSVKRENDHWEKMENIVDIWKEKKPSWNENMSKQCRKCGRIGRQRTGNQGLEESHGKIKVRQREEKEKEPNESRELMLYTNLYP